MDDYDFDPQNPLNKVYKPSMKEWATVGAVLASIAAFCFACFQLFKYYKERQVLMLALESPTTLYQLTSGKVVASDHPFALFLKREIDFCAKWFKDRPKEDLEPPSEDQPKVVAGAPQGISNFLLRSMGDEDFFLLKFSEEEHDILVKNAGRLARMQRSIQMLGHWSLLKFYNGLEQHESKLQRLWDNLMPNTKLKSRQSQQWIEIGFQGKDPSTDFRGSGMLGLDQLLFITDEKSEYRGLALKFFEVSQKRDFWYFFAVAGLNITKKLLTTLKEDKCEALKKAIIENWQFLEDDFNKRRTVQDDATMVYNNMQDSQEKQRANQLKVEQFLQQECVLFDLFNHLYFQILKLFNEYWIEQPKHDIMRFNQFLNFVIFQQVFLPKAADMVNEYVHQKKDEKKKQ